MRYSLSSHSPTLFLFFFFFPFTGEDKNALLPSDTSYTTPLIARRMGRPYTYNRE